MILGRSLQLWTGLTLAVLDVVGLIVVVYSGKPLDAQTVALIAGINGLVIAILALLANQGATGSYFGRTDTSMTRHK